jgi:hypothetical protein
MDKLLDVLLSPTPRTPPVQSDLVIWVIWVLMIELQIGVAVEW